MEEKMKRSLGEALFETGMSMALAAIALSILTEPISRWLEIGHPGVGAVLLLVWMPMAGLVICFLLADAATALRRLKATNGMHRLHNVAVGAIVLAFFATMHPFVPPHVPMAGMIAVTYVWALIAWAISINGKLYCPPLDEERGEAMRRVVGMIIYGICTLGLGDMALGALYALPKAGAGEDSIIVGLIAIVMCIGTIIYTMLTVKVACGGSFAS